MMLKRQNVMRGEETQLAGIGESHAGGLVCMPGTHCKWMSLEGGRVTGMSSFMTGEIFAVLARRRRQLTRKSCQRLLKADCVTSSLATT
jgi:2-keto-3-deoxy-galactonokinase